LPVRLFHFLIESESLPRVECCALAQIVSICDEAGRDDNLPSGFRFCTLGTVSLQFTLQSLNIALANFSDHQKPIALANFSDH
jgi:hypothetical protein